MGTRCYIGILFKTGKVKYIYIHFDGNPGYMGKILKKFYIRKKDVLKLIKLGSHSSINEDGIPQEKMQDFKQNLFSKSETEYYSNNHIMFIEYYYLFKPNENKWYVNMQNLDEYVEESDEESVEESVEESDEENECKCSECNDSSDVETKEE